MKPIRNRWTTLGLRRSNAVQPISTPDRFNRFPGRKSVTGSTGENPPVGDVSFLPAAQVDYDEALAWYLKRSARAATGFEAAVAHGVQRIADDPETYALIDKTP